jgi:hypothetical protein
MDSFRNLIFKNIDLCFSSKINISNIENESLDLSEICFKLKDNSLSILNKNENQDNLRLDAFIHLIKKCNLSSIDSVFILNMYEGIYEDVLVSRFCYTAKPNSNHILIPDSHNFLTYQKVLEIEKNDISFSSKEKKAVFGGSDTGARRKDGWTMRSLLSFLHKDSKLIQSKITFPDADFKKRFSIDRSEIIGDPISIQEQLKYQIILNVNGNSTSWERLLWAMSSNSLCVFIKPFDGEEMYSWYYPIIESLGICPMVEVTKIEEFLKCNDFEDSFWKEKNKQQKEFAKIVSNINFQADFLTQTFMQYNEKYNS